MHSNLESKCFFLGLTALGWAAGCVEPDLTQSSQSEAGSICAFVTGSALGQMITTPSIAVIVPDTQITTDPLRVHIDETQQSIVGYSLRTPGVDHEIAGQDLFIPGPTAGFPSFTQTLPQVEADHGACLAAGVMTPAVPIHIPASVLQIPGASMDVPAITVTFLGKQLTTPGKTLFLEGRTIILPGADATVVPITVETPAKTVAVRFGATQQPPAALPPAIILAPRLQ